MLGKKSKALTLLTAATTSDRDTYYYLESTVAYLTTKLALTNKNPVASLK